jgi:bifunctional DNA-binding transcriptional regulator/antitoxin component of YhaV-PrlF toxin-antitoxin module
VKVSVNGVTIRTTVSVYGGASYVGFRKEIREAAGIRIGDRVRIHIEPDVEPRAVEVPKELARALGRDARARQEFEDLSFTHRKEHSAWVAEARRAETRQRRAEKAVTMLRQGVKHP